MAVVKDFYRAIDRWAPFNTQMDFDNSGFLVGRGERTVTKVLVALDITRFVIEEAEQMGAQLIVAHHPVIFRPLKSVTDGDLTGGNVLLMAEKGIAAICAHTNLDAAQGGVNCALARKLELTEIGQLHPDGVDEQGREYGIGRVGMPHTSGLSVQEYADLNSLRSECSIIIGREVISSSSSSIPSCMTSECLCPLCGYRQACHQGGCGRRFLRGYDGGCSGKGMRHLRHRRCEV